MQDSVRRFNASAHSHSSGFLVFFIVYQSQVRKGASMTSWLTLQAPRMKMRRIKRRCLNLSSLTDLCCLATTSRCPCPKGKPSASALLGFPLSSRSAIISKRCSTLLILGQETGCFCPTSSVDFGCPPAVSDRPSPTWRW